MNRAVGSANGFDGRSEIGPIGPKRLFITGGTGFFGKSMLDYRLRHPAWPWAQAEWVILSRSPDHFAASCPRLANQVGVSFAAGDVRDFVFPEGHFDAIIHAATSAVTTLSDAEMTSMIMDGCDGTSRFDGRTVFGQLQPGSPRLFITGGTGFFGKSMLDYRIRLTMAF